ncbi:tetratricopeptide repeat protein [Kribbella solani]|uniref:tetratricopeptide repeat protein n=1 Tax=Kribbella solani TaxID=236067 RepID=UPI0029B8D401|nr:tetratricopeptide repeat protein [Kribbella solani]MDX2970973.1 tetratricopeptide repeat protein [Kribbella solani]
MRVWKFLYAVSGNQCAFDGCDTELTSLRNDGEDVVLQGELAHIVGAHRNGPRGESELTDQERARPSNIILLCNPCHDLVDQNPKRYPVEILHEMKLRHEQRVRRRAVADLPRTLPRKAVNFLGRDEVIAVARTRLTEQGSVQPAILVTGPPGIGKTELAVQIASSVAEHYPDGQVFLRGDETSPDRDLVGDLLALLVGNRDDADSNEERLARLQDALSVRRLLVIADDVSSEAELLPLLEVDAEFGLVATSRLRLSGLTDRGMYDVRLDRLAAGVGAELIRLIAPRLDDSEAAELESACGGHPLALRIAASRLASRPAMDVARYTRSLIADDALNHLSAGERTVAKVIKDSYQNLSSEEAALIRVLGALPPTTLPLEVIAAAATSDEDVSYRSLNRTESLLDDLFERHLVEQPLDGWYQMHDLLHMLARALDVSTVVSWSPLDNATRAFARRLDSAIAHEPMMPAAGPVQRSAVRIVQLEQDRHAALAVANLAVKRESESSVELLAALFPVLLRGGCWRDLQRVSHDLLSVGEKDGNADWIASAEHNLGIAARHMGDFDAAARHLSRCEVVAKAAGDLVTMQAAREAYGTVLISLGRYDEAIPLLKMSLIVWRRAGLRSKQASTLCTLGITYLNIGDLRRAEQYLLNGRHLAAAEAAEELPSLRLGLSCLYRQSGRPLEAEAECLDVLDIARRTGDRALEGLVLLELGVVLLRRDTAASAGKHLEAALALFREMEDRIAESRALHLLGVHHRTVGRIQQAIEYLDASYTIAVELDLAAQAAQSLADLAILAADLGQKDASQIFEAAEDIAAHTGSHDLLVRIQHSHGLTLLRTGAFTRALGLLSSAWNLVQRQPHSDLRDSVRVALGDALIHNGHHGLATSALRPVAEAVSGTVSGSLRATANRLLAVVYSRRQLWAEAEAALKLAVAHARDSSDTNEEVHCLTTTGNLHARRDNWTAAIAAFDAALSIAVERPDPRTTLTLLINRWGVASRSGYFPSTDAALAECEKILTEAKQAGLDELLVDMLHNKGAYLALSGHLDEAASTFQEVDELSHELQLTTNRIPLKTSLARLELQRGHLERAAAFAAEARTFAESQHNWPAAVNALKLQLLIELGDGPLPKMPSIAAAIPAAWSVRPEVVIALHSELLANPDAEPAPGNRGRIVRISDEIRTELAEFGCDLQSLLPRLEESDQSCVICQLPIARDGSASLMVETSTDAGQVIMRLAHANCAPPSVVRSTTPMVRNDTVRYNVECALLGPSGVAAGIVVDCYGGWYIGKDGRGFDAILTILREVGFTDVRSSISLVPRDQRWPSISASIDGNQLRVSGLNGLFDQMPLRFNTRWYRTAIETQTLVMVFGRDLPSMSWDDPSYMRRAAEAGRLVSTLVPLSIRPPGRNASCVCEAETSLKFKRCCGAA